MKANGKDATKCYNSWSCIMSVLIIVFVLGSILWDMTVSKPRVNQAIDEINIELKDINTRLDNSYIIAKDTTNYAMPIYFKEYLDSMKTAHQENILLPE